MPQLKSAKIFSTLQGMNESLVRNIVTNSNSLSCGWSDGRKITAVPTSDTKLGTVRVTYEELQMIIAEGELC